MSEGKSLVDAFECDGGGLRPQRFVFIRGKKWDDVTQYELHELDADTLSDLCDRYRASVFEIAGKKDPRQPNE